MNPDVPRPRLTAQQSHLRPHVLIISDDRDLAEFLSEGLPLGGFWTSLIASGIQALEVFRLRQFDLILLDADLGNFDAIELARRLRGRSELDPDGAPRTPAPIVLIGANNDEPRDDDLDIIARFAPPIDLDELVRSLHELFAIWRTNHPLVALADSAEVR